MKYNVKCPFYIFCCKLIWILNSRFCIQELGKVEFWDYVIRKLDFDLQNFGKNVDKKIMKDGIMAQNQTNIIYEIRNSIFKTFWISINENFLKNRFQTDKIPFLKIHIWKCMFKNTFWNDIFKDLFTTEYHSRFHFQIFKNHFQTSIINIFQKSIYNALQKAIFF